MVNNILSSLSEYGWKAGADYVASLMNKNKSQRSTDIGQILLNTDIKEYGLPSLQLDNQKNYIIDKFPIILQVVGVRNISAPKANQESNSGPRFLKVTVTDGSNSAHGIELEFISALSTKTAPGTKIRLKSKVSVHKGFLFLTPSNTEVLGGIVKDLYEKWSVSQSVSRLRQTAASSGGLSGPPPWVPFGQHLNYAMEKNFKAMQIINGGKEQQKSSVVVHVGKTPNLENEANQKVFGGGREMLDRNVQKIVNMGPFTIEEAEMGLRRSRNNVQKAVEILKREVLGIDSSNSDRNGAPPRGYSGGGSRRGRRGGGRRGRGRGRGRGKGGGVTDDDDDDFSYPSSRPSAPASLFDYLDKKIQSSNL